MKPKSKVAPCIKVIIITKTIIDAWHMHTEKHPKMQQFDCCHTYILRFVHNQDKTVIACELLTSVELKHMSIKDC